MPNNTQNFSKMLIDISGDLLTNAYSPDELQSRLNIVVTSWNFSLMTKDERQLKLKRLIRKQKSVAPSKDAWKSLEAEIKQIIKRKLDLYPDEDTELIKAEAHLSHKKELTIQVFFKDDAAKEQEATLKDITNFNTLMSK